MSNSAVSSRWGRSRWSGSLTPVTKKLLRPAGSVALLAFLAWRTDWGEIARAFAGLRLGWWLLAVGLYAMTQVVSSLRWRLLAGPLGFRQTLRQFIAYYY